MAGKRSVTGERILKGQRGGNERRGSGRSPAPAVEKKPLLDTSDEATTCDQELQI